MARETVAEVDKRLRQNEADCEQSRKEKYRGLDEIENDIKNKYTKKSKFLY